ncbi:50S ribosomal protein L30 [Leptospirillum ferriphilum]|jgi:large subunit ribosomal protein L30|uniref:50S ribosomal protein L30 n=1 Tax=Leptospirillum sp. Group II '5-way CG' TaxID=419541 RepID=B6API8_9BACT|nr:MAG: Ribosomal protein L30 [Leptospirillum sp. Group II '5-way CG']
MNNENTQLEITLRKSLIGTPMKIKKVLIALGLKHINQKVIHFASPSILGMINKTQHMISVEHK